MIVLKRHHYGNQRSIITATHLLLAHKDVIRVCSNPGYQHLFDLKDDTLRKVDSLAEMPDGRVVATAFGTGTVSCWEIQEGATPDWVYRDLEYPAGVSIHEALGLIFASGYNNKKLHVITQKGIISVH